LKVTPSFCFAFKMVDVGVAEIVGVGVGEEEMVEEMAEEIKEIFTYHLL
jgi:hypothetical protein